MRDSDEFGADDSVERGVRINSLQMARDRLRLVSLDAPSRAKREAVEIVEDFLDSWKLERVGKEGLKIPITTTLANGKQLKGYRIETPDQIHPWQCAGGNIKCDADLYRYLLSELYPGASRLEYLVGSGVAIALLLDRDGHVMALESLMNAVAYLWMCTFAEAKSYRELMKVGREQQEDADKRRHERNIEVGRINKQNNKGQKQEWKRIAGEHWKENIHYQLKDVAKHVRNVLVARRDKALLTAAAQSRSPTQKEGKKPPAVTTIANYLSKERLHATIDAQLTRAMARAKP